MDEVKEESNLVSLAPLFDHYPEHQVMRELVRERMISTPLEYDSTVQISRVGYERIELALKLYQLDVGDI